MDKSEIVGVCHGEFGSNLFQNRHSVMMPLSTETSEEHHLVNCKSHFGYRIAL